MSPTIFNIYIDDMMRTWKILFNLGIQHANKHNLNVMLFADDLILIQKNENNLHYSMFNKNNL